MDESAQIVSDTTVECQECIELFGLSECDLPDSLMVDHLSWMLTQIPVHANDWPVTKLHRWIGFVHRGMIAHGMLTFVTAMEMFGKARDACGPDPVDQDLIDHLDPKHSFRFEIDGES